MTLFPSLFETRRAQPRETEAAIQVDFTGGINPCSNETKLLANEVKDACNVDFQPDGGICRRNAFQPFGFDLPSPPCSDPICYETPDGVAHFIVELENGQIVDITNGPVIGPLAAGDGSAAVNSLGWQIPGDCKLTGCEVCGNLYVTKGDGWFRWDGTSLVPVDKGFREDQFEDTELPDFSTFCQTGIPCGQECIVWDSRFWVARTTIQIPVTDVTTEEGPKGPIKTGTEPRLDANDCPIFDEVYDCSGLYYSFSFGPGDREGPEDFFAEWNYRLKTSGNDCIVKMVAAGTRMYVFQQNSITLFEPFYGEPAAIPYQLFSYSTGVGAVGDKACCVEGNGIWFFDAQQGLMRINGEGSLEGHFDKVRCILTDGTLAGDQSDAAVGCCNGRVWVSLKSPGSDVNDVTYVYDPRIEAWTIYKQGFICFKNYQPTGNSPEPCGEQEPRESFCVGLVVDPCPSVVILDRETDENLVDNFGYIRRPIESSVTTGWFDAGVSEAIKDWCGFEMVFEGEVDQSMSVTGFGDWNPCDLIGQHQLQIGNPKADAKLAFANDKIQLGSNFTECSVDDPTPRARPPRSGEASVKPVVGLGGPIPLAVRMGKLCPSRSLCLSFNPSGDGKWNLCRLTMFFKRKPVRC